MTDNWLDEFFNGPRHTDEPEKVMVSPGYTPSPPTAWGSGRPADHLIGATAATIPSPVSTDPGKAPETPSHVRKAPETPAPLKVPPMPSEPPAVPKVSDEEETLEETETETTGRIRAVVDRMREAKEVTKEKVSKVTGPVGEKMTAVRNEADPKQARKWGLLWSTGAAWVVSPGTLGALYDRIVDGLGTWTDSMPRAAYLDAGGVPHEWDLLEGPAWWVKNTVGAAWEAGLTGDLLSSAGVGIAPVLAVTLLHTSEGGLWGQVVKALRWFAMLGVAYYIGFEWFPQWWEVYLSALSAAAVYGWMMAKRLSSEFLAFLLRIPAAAIVSGTILYSPGAIF